VLPNAKGLRLPPRELVPKPDDDDPIDYYYRPLTGRLYRARLQQAVDLLGQRSYGSLLEVGYGSGVFLPELARHAERLVAIDIHGVSERVEDMLRSLGIDATLFQASLFELPFDPDEFDGLVCISVLEHLTELERALDEFRRVLRPGGILVLGFPVRNPLTDGFFRLAGYDPRAIHPSSHSDILNAAEQHPGFAVERRAHFPALLPISLSAYASCRCRAC
jgi:SAM-dependent methyltransferase